MTTAPPRVVRRLTSPAALALADLAALFEDLQTCLACCERLVDEIEAGADEVALEASWTTAVLSYARCFRSGKRGVGLTEKDVTATGLAGDVLGWHQAVLQVRDLYCGAANPREAFSVGAAQDEAGAAVGVALTSTRRPAVDHVSVRQTGAIAFALSQAVDRRITEQQQVVHGALKIMSRTQLDGLELLEVVQPS